MTKQEFLKKYKEENLTIGAENMLVLDEITDEPFVLGCAFDQGVWKVYRTGERGGHYVIKEFANEDDAFDFLYGRVLYQHNIENDMY
jgi:hypothetical protein